MKRVFDLVVAAAAVALLAPLMLAIGIAVRLGLGSPVLVRAGAARTPRRPLPR